MTLVDIVAKASVAIVAIVTFADVASACVDTVAVGTKFWAVKYVTFVDVIATNKIRVEGEAEVTLTGVATIGVDTASVVTKIVVDIGSTFINIVAFSGVNVEDKSGRTFVAGEATFVVLTDLTGRTSVNVCIAFVDVVAFGFCFIGDESSFAAACETAVSISAGTILTETIVGVAFINVFAGESTVFAFCSSFAVTNKPTEGVKADLSDAITVVSFSSALVDVLTAAEVVIGFKSGGTEWANTQNCKVLTYVDISPLCGGAGVGVVFTVAVGWFVGIPLGENNLVVGVDVTPDDVVDVGDSEPVVRAGNVGKQLILVLILRNRKSVTESIAVVVSSVKPGSSG